MHTTANERISFGIHSVINLFTVNLFAKTLYSMITNFPRNYAGEF